MPRAPDAFDVIKRALRARGLAYRDVARTIGLSESAVKKIFAARDTSITRLEQLAGAAGLPLSEVFRLAEEPPLEVVEIDEPRQKWLLAHPDAFRLFWKLAIERAPIDAARRELGLDARAAKRLLLQLDARGLVRLDGERIRIPHGPLVRWDDRGPLLRALNERWSRRLARDALAGEGLSFRLHELHVREETAGSLRDALEALFDDVVRRARWEQLTVPRRSLVPVRLLAALARGGFLDAEAGAVSSRGE